MRNPFGLSWFIMYNQLRLHSTFQGMITIALGAWNELLLCALFQKSFSLGLTEGPL